MRRSFEDSFAIKARGSRYDAVVSYDVVPDVEDMDEADITQTLVSKGVEAVIMLHQAAVGPGSSIESVGDTVSPRLFADIGAFANEYSTWGSDDLIAVVHIDV